MSSIHRFFYSITGMLLLTFPAIGQSVLSVTTAEQPPYNDMPKLIRDFLTGPGVEVINIESNNDPRAVGYFTDGQTAIGLNRGLILSTGFAAAAMDTGGHFANNGIWGNNDIPELQAVAMDVLNDVTYFRITFRPFSDSVQFRYVFASEEYPEYPCSQFNDVFGFFLRGPNPMGGNYADQNIALIPGTSLPVTINNIHINNPNYPPCFAVNSQYYHDNLNSPNQPVYDGFTDVFVAQASVVPCATYVMLLAIGDVSDSAYDSSVFLEAKSWASNIEVTSSLTNGSNLLPEPALADTIYFSFANVPAAFLPMQIEIGGTATNGIDYQAVDSVTLVQTPFDTLYFLIQPVQDSLDEALETVEFNISGMSGNSCFSKTFTLYLADPDSLYSPVDTVFFLTGGSTELSFYPAEISKQTWSFTNSTPVSINETNILYKSEIQVQLPVDSIPGLNILGSVCFNIEHGWDDDLDLYLIAPDGKFVELSTDNGGNGQNYEQTCFSPNASEDIRGGLPVAPASAAPFTGTFLPEGDWQDIKDSPVNGSWSLSVLDDNASEIGTLLDWSITFSGQDLGDFKYKWSTGETTATILIQNPGIYSVTVSNAVGSLLKTFVVGDPSVATAEPVRKQQVFHLMPNPASGATAVVLDQNLSLYGLKIYDLQGVLLLEQSSAGSIRNAEKLPNGIYLVVLETAEGRFVQKLVRR